MSQDADRVPPNEGGHGFWLCHSFLICEVGKGDQVTLRGGSEGSLRQ